MERLEPSPNQNPPRITELADISERLASQIDRNRQPDGHIYAALDQAGIRDVTARKGMIGKIKIELHRRRRAIIEDARRLEVTHPQDEDAEK